MVQNVIIKLQSSNTDALFSNIKFMESYKEEFFYFVFTS